MKGKGFLRVTGILMIICGALTILACAIVALAFLLVGTFFNGMDILSELPSNILVIVAAIILAVGGIVELIAGIVGVRNAARPEKYKACIGWGIVALALQVIGILFSFITGNVNQVFLVIAVIFGVIVPILFIIGALINRRASLSGANSIEWAREKLSKKEKRLDKKEVKFNRKEDIKKAKYAKKEAREAQEAARKEASEVVENTAKEALENPVTTSSDITEDASDALK